MIKRLLRARGTRKFLRNRLAVFSLGVIGLYFLVFILVAVFGIITRADTEERVLNRNVPGFLQGQDIEARYNNLAWQHGRMERVFSRPVADEATTRRAYQELALAERTLADGTVDEIIDRWRAFAEIYETLDNAYLDLGDMRDELAGLDIELEQARDDEDEASIEALLEERPELVAEVEILEAAYLEALPRAEASLLELMPMPDGAAGVAYSLRTSLGSDISGRSIAARGLYSIKTAFQIGFVVATFCVLVGTLLGAVAAFYGGWLDAIVMWLVSTLSSVPYLVLLAVLAFMFTGSEIFDNPAERPELQLVKLYAAMGLTFWISTCRVIRGEVMKIKELEYVQAATAIGFGKPYILLKHVIPNTVHLMFINFSLLFIGAIKSEVILSFLGLGVSGQPSWGTMISNSKDDLSNYFLWEVLTAGVLMFFLVLAFNIVSDALQDAFDPKHVD